MEHKRVKIVSCENKLSFIRAIYETTGKSLLESKNIADLMVRPKFDSVNQFIGYEYGTLLLNESSVTPTQWEKIVSIVNDLKWEYV